MPETYQILYVSKVLNKTPGEIFALVREGKLIQEAGEITGESLSKYQRQYTVRKEKTTPDLQAVSKPETFEDIEGEKKPSEKQNRRHNPSALHNFIGYSQLEEFLGDLSELGENEEDLGRIPKGFMFGGLVSLMKLGIIDRHFDNCSLEEVVSETYKFYPLEMEGERTGVRYKIPDNIWLVKGAQICRSWKPEQIERVKKLRDQSEDDLDFTYKMRNEDSDLAMSASLFAMALEGDRFVRANTVEQFKWLANGLLLYKNISKELKDEINYGYEESHGRPIEFSYWLFKNNIFKKMQEHTGKKVADDNAYLSAVMFALKDSNPKIKLSLSMESSLGRNYGAYQRMQRFKGKGKKYDEAIKRIKKDISRAIDRREKLDVDQFIANTLERKDRVGSTYEFFYNNYCGRGIQYSTFVDYAAAALLIESKDDELNKKYASLLSKAAKERRVEKVDRLRGKGNGTVLVESCKRFPTPTMLYQELEKNWDRYKEMLQSEGCWIGRARETPFTQGEVNEMYRLVARFPDLFRKRG